jgi:hypothetical protein
MNKVTAETRRKNYDPIHGQKLSRLRTDQLETLGRVELSVSIFSLMMSQFSWKFEFDEQYGKPLLGALLSMQMFCGGLLMVVTMLKKKLQLLRLIALNEVRGEIKIFDYFPAKWVLFEVLCVGLHPSPFFIGRRFFVYNEKLGDFIFYNVNDIFTMILAVKACWYIRNFLTTSKYGSDRAFRVCRMFGAEPGIKFTLRAMMKDDAKFCVFSLFLGGAVFHGWMIMIAEGPMDRRTNEMDHTRFFTAMWAAIVTMTTVGYGDMYPRTDIGRIIMVCCSIYGVVIVSAMVVTLTNELEMTPLELQSWTVMKKLE